MWEEGRWSGSRVTRFSALLLVLVVGVDLLLQRELGPVFDVGFIAICIFMAMAVRPLDFFRVGVLPPLLLFGLCLVLALAWRDAIAEPQDGVVQAVVSGLAHRATALFVGYALVLVLLALRHRVLNRAPGVRPTTPTRPHREAEPAGEAEHRPTPEKSETTQASKFA